MPRSSPRGLVVVHRVRVDPARIQHHARAGRAWQAYAPGAEVHKASRELVRASAGCCLPMPVADRVSTQGSDSFQVRDPCALCRRSRLGHGSIGRRRRMNGRLSGDKIALSSKLLSTRQLCLRGGSWEAEGGGISSARDVLDSDCVTLNVQM